MTGSYPKVAAVIEARMGSTRLPGKTMSDIAGKPLLERVIERITLSRSIDTIVIATSTNRIDNVICDFCEHKSLQYYRGSEDDVLGRVYGAAKESCADIIVQAGADCPFYDPELIDFLVYSIKWGGYAYAANDMELTFPLGVDAHIIRFDALEASALEAQDSQEREDTPRFIWNNPGRFMIFSFKALPGSRLNRPDIRLTVDYEEDLELTRLIYEKFTPKCFPFHTRELIEFLDSYPEYIQLNRHCIQRATAYE